MQKTLDLEGGEAAYGERLNDIELAIDRLGRACDAELSLFLRLVFSYTHGGRGAYRRSVRQLTGNRGLCCEAKKVQQTIATAEQWGLVTVVRARRPDGAPVPNEYKICWEGVRHVRFHGTPWLGGGVLPGNTGVLPGNTGVLPGNIYIRNKPSSCRLESNSGTGPESRPAPADFSEEEQDPSKTPSHPADRLREELVRTVPELIAAVGVSIAPEPPGNLLYGVYKPLEAKHINAPACLVPWFRQQLSLKRPIMAGTEADLLLVVAAALYATNAPWADVRRNRVALFVHTVSRWSWRRAVPYVPEARRLVDGAAEKFGPKFLGRCLETAGVTAE